YLCSLYVTAVANLYTLSLHDALPIYRQRLGAVAGLGIGHGDGAEQLGIFLAVRLDLGQQLQGFLMIAFLRQGAGALCLGMDPGRSEEHTSELQSRENLVCRLLREKIK